MIRCVHHIECENPIFENRKKEMLQAKQMYIDSAQKEADDLDNSLKK